MPSSPLRHSWVALSALGLSCAASPPAASPEPPSADPAAEMPEPAAPTGESGPSAGDAATASSAEEAPGAAPQPADPAAPAPRDTRTRDVIAAVMADNRGKVRACYDAALAANPGIHGALVINFVIDPRGNVKQAEVDWPRSDIHVPELDTCAMDAIRTIQFPPSSRGLESSVTYPFNFNPPRTPPPSRQP